MADSAYTVVPVAVVSALKKSPYLVSALLAYGPIGMGFMMRNVYGDSMAVTWPFHKERLAQFSFGLAIGMLVAVVPVYHLATTLLTGKGEAVYCQIWQGGCAAV